jgi:uncharacterized membrane protein YfhO
LIKIILLVFVILNAAFNAFSLYKKKDYMREFMDKTKSYLTETENHLKIVKLLNDDSFFRIEDIQYYAFIEIRNLALNMQVKSVGFFYSLVNPYVSQFNNEIELYNHQEHEVKNIDSRTMIGTLANVKYFILPSSSREISEIYLPYGYDEEVAVYTTFDGKKYSAFKNKYAVPFGYTYSSYLPRNVYQNLSPVQKQEALMQGAVIDEDLGKDFTILNDLKLRGVVFDMPILDGNSIGGQFGKLIIPFNGFTANIFFNGILNSETYIRFHNIAYLSDDKYANFSNVVMSRMGESTKGSEVLSNKASWFSGKKDFMLNMGFNKENRDTITLAFQKAGVFNCESIQVISLPIGDGYKDEVFALKRDCLENVKERTNGISGEISLKENKILLLSIPYSKGWTAFVNGKKTKLLKANTMFMALPLKAGDYEIELKYITPGLKLGALISLFGCVLFGFLFRTKKVM